MVVVGAGPTARARQQQGSRKVSGAKQWQLDCEQDITCCGRRLSCYGLMSARLAEQTRRTCELLHFARRQGGVDCMGAITHTTQQLTQLGCVDCILYVMA